MRRLFLLIFSIIPTVVIFAQNTNSDTLSEERIVKTPYDSVIVKADSAVAIQNFTKAKEYYTRALQLKPRDPFALEMLREMNNTMRIQAQAQVREDELKRKAEITATLDNALKAILEKRYDTAKALYIKVLTLKPVKSQEQFAIQKINSIDQALGLTNTTLPANKTTVAESAQQTQVVNKEKTPAINAATSAPIAAATTIKKPAPAIVESKIAQPKQKSRLDLLIDSAQKAVTEMNYEKAYSLYSKFLSLNPSKVQRDAAMAKMQALTTELKKSQDQAASKAATVAPGEAAPMTQQKNDSIAAIANQSEQKKAVAVEADKQKISENPNQKAQFDAVVTKAIKALNEENWPVALDLYNQALTLNPTKVQEAAIRKEIDVINGKIAKSSKKLRQTNIAAAKIPAPASATTDTIARKPVAITQPKQAGATSGQATQPLNTATTSAKPTSSTFSQNTAGSTNKAVSSSLVPKENTTSNSSYYSNTSTPDLADYNGTQVFDTTDEENMKQNKEFSKKFITQPSRLNISDSSNDVKLTCQGIAFNGKNVFIKFLIRNESSSPFNIGNFQLLYLKNYGILKKLNPRYISETPAILPNKDYPVVYVTEAPRSIQPDEVFVFEMEDQSKQIHMIVNVAGADFLQKSTVTVTKITIDEAAKHIGETVTICDNVSGGRFLDSSNTKPTLLNMGGVFPNHKLTILINFVDRKNFPTPPEKTYSGKNVCVTGRVIDFKGKPEIIVESPQELKLDDTKYAAPPASKPK